MPIPSSPQPHTDASPAAPEGSRIRTTRLAIIASKGTLDWAYPPLMMAIQARNKGWDVGIFFTFYGLNIIHGRRSKALKISPLGNPAMPMPLPSIVAAMPGMTAVATWFMRRTFRRRRVPSVQDLLARAVETGVRLYPCGFTIDVFGYRSEDFIAGCEPRMGSPDFLEFAKDADVTVFV
jgi:peroxiredoxin family protein